MNLNDLVRKAFGSLKPAIRRVSPFDNQQILEIESTSGIEPWKTDDFKRATSDEGAGFLVANESTSWHAPLVGFVLFNLGETEACILRLNVLKEFRREKVATSLLKRAEDAIAIAGSVKRELGEEDIQRIVCSVPETLVEMQCFMRANGYKICKTHRQRGACDVYEFEKRIL